MAQLTDLASPLTALKKISGEHTESSQASGTQTNGCAAIQLCKQTPQSNFRLYKKHSTC